ncbi:succinyl-CoA synthetase subunit beta [Ornatilinea apprima]|uniref:Succinate--CoA ligase [ADP-forming] subunit beta n=1 Tax=Ornatilinea apprima TaxID=1134406 RepID=A0A0N8GLD5_9CHLR|nr:ADP-forming succinate--CoA ligase subunit beta [Ornatilinea apprima]KPL72194.1 succinyl-CoA synthetase subunit beta [Ornatilinea apprima]
MRLQEYQSKKIFQAYGIPIPRGWVTSIAGEAKQMAEELGGKVVIKAQVLIGGRGKAGGIRLAKSPKEAEDLATIVLGMELKGLPVRRVLVDEAVRIDKEFYLGITVDRIRKMPVMIASGAGGGDIEQTAHQNPEKIFTTTIDPLIGLADYKIRDLITGIDLPYKHWKEFIKIAHSLWKVFLDYDATLAEINPLVLSKDERLLALDGKMILDDNAHFRHQEFSELRDPDYENASAREAHKYGLAYVKLDGNIGCLVNGAGLAMATMDIVQYFGGLPANFLDIGGGASAEKVSAAFRILLADPQVKVVLVNIFGGITRCDEVAKGILSTIAELKPAVPIVVRLVGTNAGEGLELLRAANMITAETLVESVQKTMDVIQGGWSGDIH